MPSFASQKGSNHDHSQVALQLSDAHRAVARTEPAPTNLLAGFTVGSIPAQPQQMSAKEELAERKPTTGTSSRKNMNVCNQIT